MKLNEINQLIVMGNGFDLQCGLKSQYKDFFNDIFKIENIKKKQSLDQMKQNFIERIKGDATASNLETLFCSYINNEINEVEYGEDWLPVSGKFLKKALSTWDLVFLALFICSKEEEASLLWCDVETVIYIVITWWLIEKPDVESRWEDRIINGYSVNPEKYFKDDFEEYLMGWDWIAQEIDSRYIKILENIIETAFKGKNEVDLLKDLNIFEYEFATYINRQTSTEEDNKTRKKNYWLNSAHLIDKIAAINSRKIADKKVNIDVLSFNYSLDERAVPYIKDHVNDSRLFNIHSWTNIHGIAAYKDHDAIKKINNLHKEPNEQNYFKLPAPIFGIDNHDILRKNKNADDPRIIFTKSFRLMDNHVNVIRSKKFQDNIDVITFYGQSLANADYSYFESIFDQYDIFHSNVKLEFYYYKGNSEEEARKNEREVMRKVVNLLTSYGLTLRNEHGENIINKMMLEQRLTIICSPE